MKLFDKIKDLFMDEVMDEDELELEEEEKEEYKEPVKAELPKVMRETISREEKREQKNKEIEFPVEKEEVKEEIPHRKFNFPIDLDNEEPKKEVKPIIKKEPEKKERKWDISQDFIEETKHSNINVLELEKETNKKVSELYAKKNEDKNVKPKFKASPVISPVYGILDKNYTKEEVKEKTDDVTTMKRPSKKVDFETVRKKAFGNLADDIKDSMLCENCELYKEVKKISALREDDLLYDMTVDEEENNKEVTIEKAYDDYEEFGVAYEPTANRKKVEIEEVEETPVINDTNEKEEKEEVLNNFSSFKSKIEKEEIEIVNNVEVASEPNEEDSIEVKAIDGPIEEEKEEVPSRSEKKKDSKVDEDFFELIDSMYKERVDE